MSLEQKIKDLSKGNSSALVVCCWDVGMPRKEPRIVKAFLPAKDETKQGYAKREQGAKSYADAMTKDFVAKRGNYTAEEAALLVIAPGSVDRELDYFVANANGRRV